MKARPHETERTLQPAQRIVLRPSLISDVPAIMALDNGSPSAAHWPESAYREIFAPNSSTRIAIVMEEGHDGDRHLRGFIIARLAVPDCELENIVVDRKLQRRGFGKQLIESLTAPARAHNATRIFLEVRESNSAARALYESCGFAISGRRPSYYAAPIEDAVLYTLQL